MMRWPPQVAIDENSINSKTMDRCTRKMLSDGGPQRDETFLKLFKETASRNYSIASSNQAHIYEQTRKEITAHQQISQAKSGLKQAQQVRREEQTSTSTLEQQDEWRPHFRRPEMTIVVHLGDCWTRLLRLTSGGRRFRVAGLHSSTTNTVSPLVTLVLLTLFQQLLFTVLLLPGRAQLALAQCPWARESLELHSDCICDFNPSTTTNLEAQHPINRMSVQCSPVNFHRLLEALKQTASVELPKKLAELGASSEHQTSHLQEISVGGGSTEELHSIGLQVASQAKLDLLHVSNSSIRQLEDNTFIMNLNSSELNGGNFAFLQPGNSLSGSEANNNLLQSFSKNIADNDAPPGERLQVRHLVVAIQSLHLSRCSIERIQVGAFNGLEWSLTSLSLSDNQLSTVPSDALRRLFNLKVLDLSNNKLIKIKANSFVYLNKLNTLRLADNRIGHHQSMLAGAQQVLPGTGLAAGDASGGGVRNGSSPAHLNQQHQALDSDAFAGLEECLSDLNLKNTQLDAFPTAIMRLRKLAFLNLAQNQISHIPAKSFERTNSLTAINLERNRISRIDDDTFLGVESSLSSLSLLGNLLDTFPAAQLAKLGAIRRLDMGFNGIEHLPVDAFISNKRLILVALDGNPLETLPEAAFKPLEGTLRGMSIGGKALNCDCRLSWMLRWQQEYNIQISSRERQPQFCAKPNYLRSLVSFAALKPEHLTCNTITTLNLATMPTTVYAQPLQTTTMVHKHQQHQRANFFDRASSSRPPSGAGWLAGGGGHLFEQPPVSGYFTLPVQFSPDQPQVAPQQSSTAASVALSSTTVSTTTQPATTSTNSPTMMDRYSEVAASTTMASTSTSLSPGAQLTSVTTTQEPITTTTSVIEPDLLAPVSEGSTDLTEAGTNDEPTLRSDEIPASSSTEISILKLSTPNLAPNSSQPLNLSTPSTPLAATNKTALQFGARTSSSSTISQHNWRDLSLQLASNSLGSLPDDELFVTNPSKKLNRNGFLPTAPHRHRTVTPTNSGQLEEILRSSPPGGDAVARSRHSTQMSTTTSGQHLDLQPATRRLNRTNSPDKDRAPSQQSAAASSVQPDFSSGTDLAPTSRPVDPGTRIRPIHSVFGSRSANDQATTTTSIAATAAAAATSQQQQQISPRPRENRRANGSMSSLTLRLAAGGSVVPPAAQANASFGGNSASGTLVPAVPTTINVYKMPYQLAQYTNQTAQGHQRQATSEFSSLLKGARFVDEHHHQVSGQQMNSNSSAHVRPHTTTPVPLTEPQLSDSDIERYAIAASSVQARVSQVPTRGSHIGGTLKQSPGEPASSTSSSSFKPATSETAGALPSTPPPLALTTISRMFANNTRMSVSSMYRLATSSTPTSRPATSSALTSTARPLLGLEAAAEDASQKITRTSALLPPATTTTTSTTTTTTTSTTTTEPPQTTESATNSNPPPTSHSDTRRHHQVAQQYEHNGAPNATTLATQHTNEPSSVPKQWANRTRDWQTMPLSSGQVVSNSVSMPITSLFPSATSLATHQAPSRTSSTPVAPSSGLESANSQAAAGTSTRMAATVRFVDSSPPSFRLVNASQVGSSTSGTPAATGTVALSRPGATILVQAPSGSSMAQRELPQSNSDQPSGVYGNQNQQQLVEVVGEQQHEAKITLVPSNIRRATSVAASVAHAPTTTTHGGSTALAGGQVTTTTTVKHPTAPPLTTISATGGQSPRQLTDEKGNLMIVAKDSANQSQEQQQQHQVPRQSRDDSSLLTPGGPSSASTSTSNPSRYLGKLLKLTSLDQLAIILAGLLCIFILILALTVICVCSSSASSSSPSSATASTTALAGGKRGAGRGRLSSSLSSSSDSDHHQGPFASGKSSPPGGGGIRCLFRSCFGCSGGKMSGSGGKHVTHMQSLILQDDDHSSGGSSSNDGLKSTGKSMLLATTNNSSSLPCGQDLLLESIRKASRSKQIQQLQQTKRNNQTTNLMGNKCKTLAKRRRSYDTMAADESLRSRHLRPLDHEASIQNHRLAHALDQEYCEGMARGVGRRRSIAAAASGELLAYKRRNEFGGIEQGDWIPDDTLSSCDSDKSCSPGANRNNRYNISEAHRAYLASKNAGQIQASMFVTTLGQQQKPPGGAPGAPLNVGGAKSGLLKTIDHDFDRMSSDKSTTDDSRAPLNSHRNERSVGLNSARSGQQQQMMLLQATLRTNTTRSFGPPVVRTRSIGRAQASYQVGQERGGAAGLIMGTGADTSDHLNSELVPMSAEDQWPEPYVEPEGDEEGAAAKHQQGFECDFDNIQCVQYGEHQQQSGGYAHTHHSGHNHLHHQQVSRSQNAHLLAAESQAPLQRRQSQHRHTGSSGSNRLAYDDAYLSNWRTMSRINGSRINGGEPQFHAHDLQPIHDGPPGISDNNNHINQRTSDTHYQMDEENGGQSSSTLVRYRSIPSSLNGQQPQQQPALLANQIVGATNWLRWTPTSFISQRSLANAQENAQAKGDSGKMMAAVGQVGGRGWHRDNHVEAVYVAANQQR